MAQESYRSKTYYLLALEPVHVGAGGLQLGRVDNAIIRESGTDLPKIPATSLAGAARHYTAMHHPERYQRAVEKDGKIVYESCARVGPEPTYCGQRDCPVCITYGFSLPEGRNFPSMVQFSDARILFFPVTSMAGPIWVTSVEALQAQVSEGMLPSEGVDIRVEQGTHKLQTGLNMRRLNLGWLLLDIAERTAPLTEAGRDALRKSGIPDEILERLVLVPDALFSHVVNNNLEVRTSTAISPITGASVEGALFTYEAIPRATVFWCDLVYKRPADFLLDGEPVERDIDWVQEQVGKGLRYMEYLGVGGMTNRGMGRLRTLEL
ncbi:MAG: type III-B CRISPR module RAMP protein Cmr4 [Chloroflexota bacterium]|nr:type III-B CRISPR module RAMP protein Cmr4 [Chloroflexota bacterium]